jgi:hypothetical protein
VKLHAWISQPKCPTLAHNLVNLPDFLKEKKNAEKKKKEVMITSRLILINIKFQRKKN